MTVDDLDEVLALKASAKSASADGDWDNAILDLEDAVSILTGTARSPRVDAELADTYGMIGGIERRRALASPDGDDRRDHLRRSVAAYDQGFDLEQGLPRGDQSTYNRVNRLIGRVLLDPQALDDPASGMAADLAAAEEILTEQLQSVRQKDPWGYSDLGVVKLLRGAPDALTAFTELERLRPPKFVYDSTLTTLDPLAAVGAGVRPMLADAADMLRRLEQQSR